MNRSFYLLLILTLPCIVPLYAQQVFLKSTANGFRDGDCLQKYDMARCPDSGYGSGVIWVFSGEDICGNDGHTIEYNFLGDTIVELRHGTRYFYYQDDEALHLIGFDNRTSSVRYDNPVLMLRYPFCYGDSVSGTFTGSGVYGDHIHLGIAGRGYTVADACGMIVCDGDTLTDILRVRHHRETVRKTGYDSIPVVYIDSLEQYLLYGDGVMAEDIYSYYKAGYRYPLITSAISFRRCQGQIYPHACHTSFYAPEQQAYDLQYDPENENIRSAQAIRSSGINGGTDTGSGDNASSRVGVEATSDGSNVYVHYDNPHVSLPVTFMVFDALSRQLSSTFTINGSGTGDITMPLLYSTQNVLLLYVTAGDSRTVIKIGKNF